MTPKVSKPQTVEEVTLLADDPGASGLRLYGSAGWVNQPAHVAANGTERLARVDGLGKLPDPPLHIESQLVPSFYVGDHAALYGRPIENLDHDRQHGTPELRAVLYAALTQYQQKRGGRLRTPVRLGVALPNQLLMGEEADRNKALARSWLMGEHTWLADGKRQTVAVKDVKVTSQGAAALFDYLLDAEGQWVPERAGAFKKEIGVISVGFDTVELTVIRDKAPYPDLTGGEKVGARRLLELYDPRGLTPLGLLEPDLRAGKLDVKALLPVWAAKVVGFIDKKWGKAWRRFAAVIVIGGGAVLLERELTLYFVGKAHIPPEPTLAVARGLYRLLLSQVRKEQ